MRVMCCDFVTCLQPCSLSLSYFDVVFFFKQKTAYEMRISDWSSDVCSSDLYGRGDVGTLGVFAFGHARITGQQSIARQPRQIAAGVFHHLDQADAIRSEERRVGEECVSTCRARW